MSRPAASTRVMIVDDNRDVSTTLGVLLELHGAVVEVHDDGHVALTRIDAFQPVVVLIDLGMPRMDGFELARRLRLRDDHTHRILVALTGWGDREQRRRTTAAGFDHHLVKPAGLEELSHIFDAARDVTSAVDAGGRSSHA